MHGRAYLGSRRREYLLGLRALGPMRGAHCLCPTVPPIGQQCSEERDVSKAVSPNPRAKSPQQLENLVRNSNLIFRGPTRRSPQLIESARVARLYSST